MMCRFSIWNMDIKIEDQNICYIFDLMAFFTSPIWACSNEQFQIRIV